MKHAISICIFVCISGCIADHPIITPEGQIVGGDKKLHEILKVIKNLRDEYAKHTLNVDYAWYSASISPTSPSVAYSNTLPAIDDAIEAEFVLLYTAPYLPTTRFAVVTEVLSYRGDKIRIKCYDRIYLWSHGSWMEYGPFRMNMIDIKDVPDI